MSLRTHPDQALLRSPAGLAGALLLLLVLAASLAAPLLFPGDPKAIAGPPLVPPLADARHPLGTDRLGRDVLAELAHGGRGTLAVAAGAAAAALLAGTAAGTLAGFLGGWRDEALMRLAEAFQTVPAFVLALAVVAALGPSPSGVIAAIAAGAWPAPARLVRAEVLSLRRRDFVDACRAVGMRPLAIAFREVLPNALPPVLALAAVVVANAVLVEAALSFLGLGDPNRVTWGQMVAEGRAVLRGAPWLAAIPGLAILATVLAVGLLGEGLAEATAPRRPRP